uniref:Inositol-pentakisphosphate 2-kinase n=1 Tax=Phallusia mammillata TaxID=59560 RepID=A0A6F9DEJ9_9ASCI|nr:inositol-pentakisphosphate 2-kinase-like [Phallusia mammillata]
MEVCDPLEWKYRAEGNKHIVVGNDKGRVLRLQKKSPYIQNGDPSKETVDIEDNLAEVLRFQEFVALPLIRNSDACHIPKQVDVAPDFVRKLSSSIESQRPESRRHKSVQHATSALLMFDHCYIPKESVRSQLKHLGDISLDSDTYSVEIKPKRGFILPSGSEGTLPALCQFCHTQLYRVQFEKRFTDCSNYCPVDLFSGDINRMKTAIRGLLNAPQNNFRIFKNGKLAYGQEVIKQNGARTSPSKRNLYRKSFLTQLLVPFICGNGTVLSSSEICSTFISMICEALMLPVIKKLKNSSEDVNRSTQGSVCKRRHLGHPNGVQSQLTEQGPNILPNNSIMGLILNAQKINSNSISEVNDLYKLLKDKSKLQNNLDSGIVIDAPYTSHHWQKFVQAQSSDDGTNNSMDEAVTKVRKFLVSKSFCDCSIMISMRKITCTKQMPVPSKAQKLTAQCNTIQDQFGNVYVVSIAVVDLDPKSSTRIPFYHQFNQKLVEWWKTLQYRQDMV